MEFNKILYMHLYLKALDWDCSLSFFTIFSQICIRAMSLDVCFYSMKRFTAGLWSDSLTILVPIILLEQQRRVKDIFFNCTIVTEKCLMYIYT